MPALVREEPRDHPRMSTEELHEVFRDYLRSSRRQQADARHNMYLSWLGLA